MSKEIFPSCNSCGYTHRWPREPERLRPLRCDPRSGGRQLRQAQRETFVS